jgi:hypothetical protein
MRMVPAGDDDGAWLISVDNLSNQTLPAGLKFNVKGI